MFERVRGGVIAVLSLLLALYNIWTGYFGYPNPLVHRSFNLLLLFVLVFLIFPLTSDRPWGRYLKVVDVLLAILAAVVFLYPMIYAGDIEQRMPFVSSLTWAQWVLGVIAVALVLEGSRRTVGTIFVFVVLGFMAYTFWGASIPGIFKHKGFSLGEGLETFYLGYNGIFGLPTAVYATYILLFILWGAFFERSGVGNLLMDLSIAVAGWARGGPAKIEVLSSALFGTVSGSAVANVYATGTITIPLMKKHGYRAEFAAAVEAASSTGGQIMPPVMGAAAFVMTEFIGIPYSKLILYAAIPACLYYLAILMMVHFEALKLGLKGLPREQLPPLGRVLARRGYVVLPLIGLITALLLDYTAIRAAFIALVMTAGLMLAEQIVRAVRSVLRRETSIGGAVWQMCRQFGEDTYVSFRAGARAAVDIGCATAGAGIIVAATTLTGLGLNLTALATKGDLPLFVVLLLIAATCILLGMAVPTTPAYIMTAALAAPAVVSLGVNELAAHMFIFYFAVMSMVTPPVALAAYAAAQIAQANIMRTGYLATYLASAGFIVPFMFIFGPELLLQGSIPAIIWACCTAAVGVVALAAALDGWCLTRVGIVDRLCFGLGALFLIHTGLMTDAIGGALLAVGMLVQWQRYRSAARSRIGAGSGTVHAVTGKAEGQVPAAPPRAHP